MESEGGGAGRPPWGREAKATKGGAGRGRQMGTEGPEAQKRDVKLSGRQKMKVERVILE